MLRQLLQISAFFLLLVITPGCNNIISDIPVEPQISFESYQLFKTNGGDSLVLVLGFADGDGDIGLEQSDSLPPYDHESIYHYNIHTRYYEKINGEFKQIQLQYPFEVGDTIHYNGRIPPLTPEGKHKAIKGTITYGILLGSTKSGTNSIKFDIWIYDRALHKSNTVSSPEIILNQ